MSASTLVTLGETMALLVTPAVGRIEHQHHLELRVGGAESNTAIAAARLGAAAVWMGRVGDDGIGELIVATLRGQGVGVLATRTDVPTSLMVKERRSPNSTHIRYYRSSGPGSRLVPADLDEAVIGEAGVLHLTGITPALSSSARETVFAAAEIARAAGVAVSFDVNYRSALWSPDAAAPVLRDLVTRADVVFVGDEEQALLAGDVGDERSFAERMMSMGPREVVVKRGERGAAVLHADGFVERPSLPVRVVDAVGAGDAFAGGYLAELLRAEPVDQRLLTAVACGAFATTVAGDWEAAPSREDLMSAASETKVFR